MKAVLVVAASLLLLVGSVSALSIEEVISHASSDASIRSRFGLTGEELFVPATHRLPRVVDSKVPSQIHFYLSQTIKGLLVEGAELQLHYDTETKQFYSVHGVLASASTVDSRQPSVPAPSPQSSLCVALHLTTLKGYLAWKTLQSYRDSKNRLEKDWVFTYAFVNSFESQEIARHPVHKYGLNRLVYTAKNTDRLPGWLEIQEGGSSNDQVAMWAYQNTGICYEYYYKTFGRDSYNNRGAFYVTSVHFEKDYNNAFWNGDQLVYGDGDGYYFSPLSKALDVCCHEVTHAVDTSASNLIYYSQSGAIAESMADIFGRGAAIYNDSYHIKSPESWWLGESIWNPTHVPSLGKALRYMEDPVLDGVSRDYYPDRYVGPEDNEGVHINSGISNLMFVLLVQGGRHPQKKTHIDVHGIGMHAAQQIMYRAFTVYYTRTTNFAQQRAFVLQATSDLYPHFAANVQSAFSAVGIN